MEREYIGAPGQSQEAVPLGALVAVSLRRVAGLGKEEDYRHPLAGGGKMNPGLFLIGIAALFLATGTAHAAGSDLTGQACIREMKEVFGVNTAKAKRMCDPKTGVKPNEYGWVCEVDPKIRLYKAKGVGTRRKRDAICE
jgi:hypothetical protein